MSYHTRFFLTRTLINYVQSGTFCFINFFPSRSVSFFQISVCYFTFLFYHFSVLLLFPLRLICYCVWVVLAELQYGVWKGYWKKIRMITQKTVARKFRKFISLNFFLNEALAILFACLTLVDAFLLTQLYEKWKNKKQGRKSS